MLLLLRLVPFLLLTGGCSTPPTPNSSTGCIERLAFECFDKDGDGFIAIPEEVKPDCFPAPPVTHASDRDNDDRLNRDEFEELQRNPQYISYVEGRTCPCLTGDFCSRGGAQETVDSTGCIERLAFECFDEDGDGFIAIPEEVKPDYFPAPPVTHASDRDNDNRLNRDEFKELQRDPQYVSYVEGRTCPSLTGDFCTSGGDHETVDSTGCIERLAFECFDKDGDRFITIPEEVQPDYFPDPTIQMRHDKDNNDKFDLEEFEELQRDPAYISYVEERTCPSLTANFCQ